MYVGNPARGKKKGKKETYNFKRAVSDWAVKEKGKIRPLFVLLECCGRGKEREKKKKGAMLS